MFLEQFCTQLDNLLKIDDKAKSLGIFVAYGIAWGNPPHDYPNTLSEELRRVSEEVRNKYPSASKLTDNPVVQAYRKFYWRLGIDPTKTRPSGEALARRLVRGQELPRIHPVVDIGNIVSARTLVPIGIYDLDHASPPFTITLSSGGELFQPIGGKDVKLDKGVPILIDSKKVVMHIYPHRDSRVTMVRDTTSKVLVIAAGVPEVPRSIVVNAATQVLDLLSRILGWSSCGKVVVKS